MRDLIETRKFDSVANALQIRGSGPDRAGVIAGVTEELEKYGLYVASITFNLLLSEQNQYEMEICAKGEQDHVQQVSRSIEAGEFWQPAAAEGPNIHWPTAFMFHIALYTPDREGLIAQVSKIVRQARETDLPNKGGSFVHMVGITDNSAGAEGGTAYFSMRANVATQGIEVQQQIEAHLRTWAEEHDIEEDLWIRDLNP